MMRLKHELALTQSRRDSETAQVAAACRSVEQAQPSGASLARLGSLLGSHSSASFSSRASPGTLGHGQACPVRGAPAAAAPRILAILNLGTGWSRGVLRGFVCSAHERRWTVLHYPPPVDMEALPRR
jgi:hypothetical protein